MWAHDHNHVCLTSAVSGVIQLTDETAQRTPSKANVHRLEVRCHREISTRHHQNSEKRWSLYHGFRFPSTTKTRDTRKISGKGRTPPCPSSLGFRPGYLASFPSGARRCSIILSRGGTSLDLRTFSDSGKGWTLLSPNLLFLAFCN